MSKKRTVIIASAAAALLIAATAALLLWPVSTRDKTVRIYIDPDDNADSVYAKIEQAASPSFMLGFRLTASLRGYASKVRTGSYEITPSISGYRLATNLAHGIQSPVNLTVPSTWTKEMAASRMARQLMTDSASISTLMNDSATCASFGLDTATIATLLLAETYQVYWNTSPKALLDRLARESRNFWTQQRLTKAQKLGLTKEQVYTLASIVDAETANNAEKPTVAGLYLNRLRKGMRLQADPTVKFALHDFTLQRIYGYMLTTPSPYNTYLNSGLPPGPIRIPQISSIDAVLNAATHDYLYMCANSDFSGTHAFAVTYSQHKANAARYVRALNERGIK